ncbi:excalibur calcium-binding domain-containing protein [Tsukamurella sp. 8F]|uniref:excalibur calcium-binding domain-containing protein n=1 Tax=unclassified Tsukamurella TaxID=2633480 RepID=UPI0023B98DE0|nr:MULTISPECIES: excalibur calcium-binding domain-containing protein [unclassified Tsukamurella]MDF0531400.1 excalibur calcium-binding domain-containing protein [Tsukamurella sp. 8J]MDF0585294.1 excalibur calcium-binding domain-containing protein [Tsukamurella sp. 8F]
MPNPRFRIAAVAASIVTVTALAPAAVADAAPAVPGRYCKTSERGHIATYRGVRIQCQRIGGHYRWSAAGPKRAVAPKKVAPKRVAPVRVAPSTGGRSFANCSAVRAAGAAPLYRGQAGYAPKLDRDGDGIACE